MAHTYTIITGDKIVENNVLGFAVASRTGGAIWGSGFGIQNGNNDSYQVIYSTFFDLTNYDSIAWSKTGIVSQQMWLQNENGQNVATLINYTNSTNTNATPFNCSNLTGRYRLALTANTNSSGSSSYNAYVKLTELTVSDDRWYITTSSNSGGSVSGAGVYKNNASVTLKATPSTNYGFSKWTVKSGTYTGSLTSNPITFNATNDVSLEATFRVLWKITFDYNSTLGSCSYAWADGDYADITATPKSNAQFMGWYKGNTLVSKQLTARVSVTSDTTFRAVFQEVYNVNTSVDGLGDIQVERQTSDRNSATISVIPHKNWSFDKYVVDGVEYKTTPVNLYLTKHVNVTAYFTEDQKFHISTSTNVENGSVYISNNDDYDGYSATLWARPIPNYIFSEWDDGNTDNPRNIVVKSDVTYLAKYTKEADANGIYQYRCFVKDQMDLTANPKAFMVVDTFDIQRDLMTNAKSTIRVTKKPTSVNNGDVLVVYDPKGDILYNGVITEIQEKSISCSQMQSYYKGSWIYNTNPSDTLEEEISKLLRDYAQGKIYGSSYTDPLVANRLGGITIDYVGSTQVSLPTDTDEEGNLNYSEVDMEKFIYSLYEDYGIIFDFEINFSGPNYVHIKVPDYGSVKVGNNMYAIQNMSPIETIEETNRLIIFGSDRTYRKTYVATKTEIVEEPTSTANRFDITNTKIVFSDDELADLVASNLPSVMYNHRLSFDLILKNYIYQFDEFNLGMPLDVWHDSDYYNSVLTGWEMHKSSNQNVTAVTFTCGKVRQKLTQRLNLGKV